MVNDALSLQFLEDYHSLSPNTREEMNKLFYKYARPNNPLTVRVMLGDNQGNIIDVVAMMMFKGSKERNMHDLSDLFKNTSIESIPNEVMTVLNEYYNHQSANAEKIASDLDARYEEAKSFREEVIKHFSKKRKWKGFPITQFADAGFQHLAKVLDGYASRYNKELEEIGKYINKHKEG